MKLLAKLRKIIRRLAITMDLLACALICILCAWVTVDVVGRGFFGKPIPGTAELAANSIVAILFLEVALVEFRKKNLRSDIILQKLGHVGQGIIEILSTVFGLVIFGCGSYFCTKGMISSWAIREYDGEGAIHIPTYLFKTVVAIGCIIMMLVLLFSLYDAVMCLLGKSPAESEEPKGDEV